VSIQFLWPPALRRNASRVRFFSGVVALRSARSGVQRFCLLCFFSNAAVSWQIMVNTYTQCIVNCSPCQSILGIQEPLHHSDAIIVRGDVETCDPNGANWFLNYFRGQVYSSAATDCSSWAIVPIELRRCSSAIFSICAPSSALAPTRPRISLFRARLRVTLLARCRDCDKKFNDTDCPPSLVLHVLYTDKTPPGKPPDKTFGQFPTWIKPPFPWGISCILFWLKMVRQSNAALHTVAKYISLWL